VIVCAGSPTVAVTLEKFERVGVAAVAPVTESPKFCPAQVPASADQVLPLSEEDSAENVGAGLTLVVGAAALHFHPIVPVPVITTK